MKQILGSITQRGQVTIPVEVQRLLGTGPRGKVVFEIDGDEVRLRRPRWTVATLAGSVKPINRPEDLEELGRIAWEEHAERTIEKMRRE